MSDAKIDQAGLVRPGEELELSVLNPWLKGQVSGISDEP
jgi:hypothetical protein